MASKCREHKTKSTVLSGVELRAVPSAAQSPKTAAFLQTLCHFNPSEEAPSVAGPLPQLPFTPFSVLLSLNVPAEFPLS